MLPYAFVQQGALMDSMQEPISWRRKQKLQTEPYTLAYSIFSFKAHGQRMQKAPNA